MIFATVGTQGQFDRLIRTVDEWAGARGKEDIFAQTGPSGYHSKHIRSEKFIGPTEFRSCVESSSLVISHAGMGSVITALEFGKPIIIMPRRANLGEHRNDHQLATARWLAEQGSVMVAFTERDLVDKLDHCVEANDPNGSRMQVSYELISSIRAFIQDGRACLSDGSKRAPD